MRSLDVPVKIASASWPILTDDTPLTLGLLLSIAKEAHCDCHMPGCPPSYAAALVNAIEGLVENPWRGGA
ncbi:MAG: hypothetical protein K0S56_510 [Microvirga sp.]|jgi:coenzyme F420-reducing hydrogenase gamma subunit|nr:hypothetical protein [Microvirga sp.]